MFEEIASRRARFPHLRDVKNELGLRESRAECFIRRNRNEIGVQNT